MTKKIPVSFYAILPSLLGEITLSSDGEALDGLFLPGDARIAVARAGMYKPALFEDAIQQLQEYFAGSRREFNLPLAPYGTQFQQGVWAGLQRIPYGNTWSYKQLAAHTGNAKASRAVGNANGKNPLCIIIPCHRVIAADGGIGGYSSGLEAKRWLLAHESKKALLRAA